MSTNLELQRIERRIEHYLKKMEKIKQLTVGKYANPEGEAIRGWLEQFCTGVGMDICSGYFPIASDAITVDGDETIVGIDYCIRGDELTPIRDTELDYVVTNYFDVFVNPLHTLQEWHRVLKPGGVLAFACCNADAYTNPEGALINKKRSMTYTENPVRHLLVRAGFEQIKVEKRDKNLLVSAKRT